MWSDRNAEILPFWVSFKSLLIKVEKASAKESLCPCEPHKHYTRQKFPSSQADEVVFILTFFFFRQKKPCLQFSACKATDKFPAQKVQPDVSQLEPQYNMWPEIRCMALSGGQLHRTGVGTLLIKRNPQGNLGCNRIQPFLNNAGLHCWRSSNCMDIRDNIVIKWNSVVFI